MRSDPLDRRSGTRTRPEDPSPTHPGTSRFVQRGRALDDLTAMTFRDSVTRTLVLIAVSAAVVTALTLFTGGPWPAPTTIPVVVVVLLLASKAPPLTASKTASQFAWGILTLTVGVGIELSAAPLWVGAALVIGILLRRRITWRIRRSRPRSLTRCTPMWALIAAGPRRGVALRYALVRLRGGERDGPRDLFTFVLSQPRQWGDKTVRAAAHIGLAALARESADITTGLDHAQSAADLLHAGRPHRLADRLILERGLLLRDGARHAEAVDTLKDASRRLWRRGDRQGAVVALAAAASSAVHGNPREGLNIAAAARDRAVRALSLSGLINTELLLAQAAAASGDGTLAKRAAESAIDLASNFAGSYAIADEDLRSAVNDQANAQGNAHLVLAREAVASGHDDEALQHAEEALRLCHTADRSYDAATAEMVAAGIQERRGKQGTALRHALTAVAHLDRSRYLLPTPRWRGDWVRSNEAAYGCALRLAATNNDARLVAELVEAARLQAVPRPARARDEADVGTLLHAFAESGEPGRPHTGTADFRSLDTRALESAAAQAALGADPLQPSPVLAIDGISLLPHAEAAAGRLRVDVSEQVIRLAGHNAWWWGAAIADGVYHWAVRGDDQFICGSTAVAEGTPGWRALTDLSAATPGPGLQEHDPSAGPLGWIGADDPHSRERDFAWRLSEAFLPPPVREHALQFLQREQQAADSSSFRLVVSLPAALSRLPAALLALQRPGSDPGQVDVPRLVEAAVIHLAPSMALMASIAGRPPVPEPGPGKPWPVLVSVVDPTDDLRNARAHGEPRVLLTGWQRLQGPDVTVSQRARPATKAELSKALLALPGRAGLLVYSGHAFPGHPDAPATGGLVLATPKPAEPREQPAGRAAHDDAVAGAQQLLTARELLSAEGEPSPYQFPARVLLSACSASGFGQTNQTAPGLDGEWLGVAAAVLQAGADEVIATLFDLIDLRGTARFENRLVALLMSMPDAAAALRTAQIEFLNEWRVNPYLRAMPPLIWAAYACLGGQSSGKPVGADNPVTAAGLVSCGDEGWSG